VTLLTLPTLVRRDTPFPMRRSRVDQKLKIRNEIPGSAGGAFPFAKINYTGERPTRSAVRTSSLLRSLRPCLRNGASQGEEAVLADSGREGEITAGVGRVRSLAFLSILEECSPAAPQVRTIEGLACRHSFSETC
jgi:hypothetical protein